MVMEVELGHTPRAVGAHESLMVMASTIAAHTHARATRATAARVQGGMGRQPRLLEAARRSGRLGGPPPALAFGMSFGPKGSRSSDSVYAESVTLL